MALPHRRETHFHIECTATHPTLTKTRPAPSVRFSSTLTQFTKGCASMRSTKSLSSLTSPQRSLGSRRSGESAVIERANNHPRLPFSRFLRKTSCFATPSTLPNTSSTNTSLRLPDIRAVCHCKLGSPWRTRASVLALSRAYTTAPTTAGTIKTGSRSLERSEQLHVQYNAAEFTV